LLMSDGKIRNNSYSHGNKDDEKKISKN